MIYSSSHIFRSQYYSAKRIANLVATVNDLFFFLQFFLWWKGEKWRFMVCEVCYDGCVWRAGRSRAAEAVTFCYGDCSSTRTWQLLLKWQRYSRRATESPLIRAQPYMRVPLDSNQEAQHEIFIWTLAHPRYKPFRESSCHPNTGDRDKREKREMKVYEAQMRHIPQTDIFKAIDISSLRIWWLSQFPNQFLTIDWYHL